MGFPVYRYLRQNFHHDNTGHEEKKAGIRRIWDLRVYHPKLRNREISLGRQSCMHIILHSFQFTGVNGNRYLQHGLISILYLILTNRTASTFPPPDDYIRQLLLSDAGGRNVVEGEDLTLNRNDRFFAVLFKKVTEALNNYITEEQRVQFQDSADVARWWRSYLATGDNRGLMYEAVRNVTQSNDEVCLILLQCRDI